ncbi:ATP-grasp domain-containing protein [Actinoplanes sp. TBRC 11911]|uniref:ATP-grasp domain-containing protein n=1 Tax=Actinoplanes sp. TBRC 11911 TaxID=2729386 RepID=UPI00145C93B4|nr:ATP-grasp domain-containing protein [Actinoplanes sp. TBRC 11911]NMO53790.1 ATP-grasp domain-containing protein [Actinoplanes sp. TBRC 11911]
MSPAILVIEPESSGSEIIRAAAALGYSSVIFESRPLAEITASARDAVANGLATYRRVETGSVRATVAAAQELAAITDLVAVIPGFELAVPLAAAVAAKLGLPGVDPVAAEGLRDKRRMKEVLRAAGVPVSRFAPLDPANAGDEEFAAIEEAVGYPAVVKPVDGSGSVFVRRVDDRVSLREAVDAVQAIDAMGRRLAEKVLVESYVTGPEFSVEGYVQNGETLVVSVTAKMLGPEPQFVEIGHTVEADLARAERAVLAETATQAVRALGMTVGVFHVEVRLSAGGPMIMEVGGRLAGDRIPALIEAVHGVDLPTVNVEVLAGRQVAVDSPLPTRGVAGVRYFIAKQPSVLAEREELHDRLTKLPGCREVVWTFPPDATLEPAADFRHRFGHILVVAADRPALRATLAEADRQVAAALRPL